MRESSFIEKNLTALTKEYKTLEELFFKSIEEYKSFEEVYPLFSRMQEIRQQIINLQANNFNAVSIQPGKN